MGKIVTQIINRFDGGRSNDIRSKSANKYAICKNFDVFTYPHKLKPVADFTAVTDGVTDIVKFLYAPKSGVQTLWALERTVGGFCEVDYTTTGTGFAEYVNNTSASGARNEDVFFYYNGFIYMWGGAAGALKLKRYDVSSAAAFEEDVIQNVWGGGAVTYTTVCQPVLHPADDIAYFFSDNYVHKDNKGSYSHRALTLPSSMKIVGACAYGNYLAIACVTANTTTLTGVKSVVYLWDRDSSLTTLAANIDFGYGEIKYIASLKNRIIVVMVSEEDREITVKGYNGVYAEILSTLTADNDCVYTASSQVVNDILYFPMEAPLNGDSRRGIWAVDSNGRLELVYVNDSATIWEGIYFTGDIWWIAYTGGKVAKTVNTSSATGTYESELLEDVFSNKKLVSVGVMYEKGSTGTIDLNYRLKDSGGWTAIVDGHDISSENGFYEAINIESDGSALPEFREIQFQAVSAATILGIVYKYEVIDDNLSI